jgi:NitT/TauT family transport system ATP-binding protein
MKQRGAIARAYAVQPSMLLRDEPFAALDAQTRDRMQSVLLDINRTESKPILFITHSVEEALFLSNRVIVLAGRPARVKTIVRVPFGAVREPQIKLEHGFLDLRHSLEDMLQAPAVGDQSQETTSMEAGL